MAFKLTAEEKKTYNELVDKVKNEEAKFKNVIREQEGVIEDAVSAINTARENMNEVIEEATSFVTKVAERLREDFDEKSESWKESDTGSDTEQFISQWETGAPDQLDEIDTPQLELPDMEFGKWIDDLPEEA